jgi:hypothetical protein
VTEFVRPHVELHHRVERLTNPDDVMIAFMLPRQLGRRRHLHAEIPFFKSHRKSRYAFRFTGDGFNFGFCGLDRFLRQPLREIAVEAPCPLEMSSGRAYPTRRSMKPRTLLIFSQYGENPVEVPPRWGTI